jgi:hypothetical protein
MKIPLSSYRHVPHDGGAGQLPLLFIIAILAMLAGWLIHGAIRDYREQAHRKLSKKMRRNKKS